MSDNSLTNMSRTPPSSCVVVMPELQNLPRSTPSSSGEVSIESRTSRRVKQTGRLVRKSAGIVNTLLILLLLIFSQLQEANIGEIAKTMLARQLSPEVTRKT